MSPGDVSGGEDHDHERCADRQRGDNTGRAGDDGAADGKNEEKRADKFRDVFVHCFWVGCLEEVFKVESSRLRRGYGEPGKVGRRNTEMRIGKGEIRKAEGKRK